MILTPSQKLPKNVSNLGKIIVATGFEKVQKSSTLVTLTVTDRGTEEEGTRNTKRIFGVYFSSKIYICIFVFQQYQIITLPRRRGSGRKKAAFRS